MNKYSFIYSDFDGNKNAFFTFSDDEETAYSRYYARHSSKLLEKVTLTNANGNFAEFEVSYLIGNIVRKLTFNAQDITQALNLFKVRFAHFQMLNIRQVA